MYLRSVPPLLLQCGSKSWLNPSSPCTSEEVLDCTGSLPLRNHHHPNGVCAVLWEHLISTFPLVTGWGKCECHKALDRGGSHIWDIRWYGRELNSDTTACTTEFLCEAVVLWPTGQMLVHVLVVGFPNQLQEQRGHSKPALDHLLWGTQ